MGRLAFIGCLFLMAAASFVSAFTGSSFAWFGGGVAFLAVAIYALRQGAREMESGRETASNKFIVFSLLTVLVGIAAIAFLASA